MPFHFTMFFKYDTIRVRNANETIFELSHELKVQLRRSATGRLRCNYVTRGLSVALRHLHGLQNKVKFNAERLTICRPKTLKVNAMMDGIDEETAESGLHWLLEIADFKMGIIP